MTEAKKAQLNLRLRPGDFAAIKAAAAAANTPTGPWCEQVILDHVHQTNLPRQPERKEFKVDPKKCSHDRLPEPGFGLSDSQCPDCGTKITRVGRSLQVPSTR